MRSLAANNQLSKFINGLNAVDGHETIRLQNEILHMTLGTVLGVFTIIVLLRDSVRQLYEGTQKNP